MWPCWKKCLTSGGLCLLLGDQDVSSQLFLLLSLHSAMLDSNPLGPHDLVGTFHCKCHSHGVDHSNRKVGKTDSGYTVTQGNP